MIQPGQRLLTAIGKLDRANILSSVGTLENTYFWNQQKWFSTSKECATPNTLLTMIHDQAFCVVNRQASSQGRLYPLHGTWETRWWALCVEQQEQSPVRTHSVAKTPDKNKCMDLLHQLFENNKWLIVESYKNKASII